MKAAPDKINNEQGVQVCDATQAHSCTIARFKKAFLRLSFFLLFTFLFLLSSVAQSFHTIVSAKKIGKNQYVEVTYEMANVAAIENFRIPQFNDWIILSGPVSSSSKSNINGQVSQKSSISYYLQPRRMGELIINGTSADLNGKTVSSKNVTIQVQEKDVNGASATGSGAPQTDPFGNLLQDPFAAQPPVVPVSPQPQDAFSDGMLLQPGENVPEKIRKNLFIKVVPSKTTCYEGEPIIATYKVYTRLDIEANVTRRPSFSGFGAYDMEDPNQPYVVDTLNGKPFKTWVIRKVQLYPLQSGTLTLDPVEVDCNIRFVKAEQVADGSFDAYSGNGFTRVQYILKSPAIPITALPLPAEGRPQDFNGAVGNFTIKAGISNPTPGKNDAVHLTIGISGSGNFSMVHAPAVKWIGNIEAYEPTETENLDKTVMPISGDKQFDYVFLPHVAGTYTIPAVPFSYFDTDSKTYKTIATQPITLQVSNQGSQQNVGENEQSRRNIPGLFVSIAAYALPTAAIGLLLFLVWSSTRRNRKKQQEHLKNKETERLAWENLVRASEAQKEERSQPQVSITPPANGPQPAGLHQAYMPAGGVQQPLPTQASEQEVTRETGTMPLLQSEVLIWQDDHRLFYKALKNDLVQVLAAKAGFNSLNKTELLQTLKRKGSDEQLLQQISSLADECDAALYSPISNSNDRQKLLEEAKFLLGKL